MNKASKTELNAIVGSLIEIRDRIDSFAYEDENKSNTFDEIYEHFNRIEDLIAEAIN